MSCSLQVLYVMHIHQDSGGSQAHFSAVSEFLLTQPCLSISILDAGRRRFKKNQLESGLMGDITTGEMLAEDGEEEVAMDTEGPDIGVLVKMYSVHTRCGSTFYLPTVYRSRYVKT